MEIFHFSKKPLTCLTFIGIFLEAGLKPLCNGSFRQLPDKVTFLTQFKDFQMLEVTESVDYLVDKLKEACLPFSIKRKVLQKRKNKQVSFNKFIRIEVPRMRTFLF